MSPSGLSYHWGIRLGAQRQKLIAAKSGLGGFRGTGAPQTIVRRPGKASQARFIHVCFFIPYWSYDAGGLGETVVA